MDGVKLVHTRPPFRKVITLTVESLRKAKDLALTFRAWSRLFSATKEERRSLATCIINRRFWSRHCGATRAPLRRDSALMRSLSWRCLIASGDTKRKGLEKRFGTGQRLITISESTKLSPLLLKVTLRADLKPPILPNLTPDASEKSGALNLES